MFSGGGNENVGTTFVDAANTRKQDIESSPEFDPEKDAVSVHAVDSIDELKNIISQGNIDHLDIYSHGGTDFLTVGSGEGPNKRQHLRASDLKGFNRNAFNEGATINLWGCSTASDGKSNFLTLALGFVSIAESFALYFRGTSVTGWMGSSMAVPSPEAKTDINYVHPKGGRVYYKSITGSRSYKYD
jgi:hypothetical protein